MKKIYSLFAVAMISVAAIAQTTVTHTFTGGNATEIKSGTVDANVTYVTATGASAQFPTFYTAVPSAVRFYSDRNTGDGNSLTLTAVEGYEITALSFTSTGATYTPVVTFSADGGAFAAMTKTGETFSVGDLTATTLTFKNAHTGGTTNTQLRIPSFTVTYKAKVTMAVGDVNAKKVNLVKNTVVESNILFAAKADVQIVNMNGQVVKSASVNENTSLDVATLPKGIYVVTANLNGKAVSQKIIKK